MSDTRERLIGTFDALPEHRRAEVLDFAEFLQKREQQPEHSSAGEPPLTPEEDPILEYAGGAAHGRLAQDIDEELYGS